MKITALSGDRVVTQGTGFTFSNLDKTWLTSNRHVMIGRRPGTNEYVAPQVGQPTAIELTWVNDDLTTGDLRLELFDSDRNPKWIEHPPLAHELDLVSIEVPAATFVDVDITDALDENPPHVPTSGDPILVIGFPFGVSAGIEGLPVAFSGIIASPPGVPLDDKPRFFIDSRTRPGLSGSPVYYYPNCLRQRLEDESDKRTPAVMFLGMYCGRLNENSDLGYVIDAEEIARTMVHQQRGKLFP
ncbi:MAG: hypothetical protein Q4G67_03665 [Actinomycetia bacterium]|nr:hypothetical protein [Actinomycetes bacterium]